MNYQDAAHAYHVLAEELREKSAVASALASELNQIANNIERQSQEWYKMHRDETLTEPEDYPNYEVAVEEEL